MDARSGVIRLCARHVLFPFLLIASASTLAAQSIDTLALRDHARVLAHDSLRGRGTGSAGEKAAARYIAGRLSELGLSFTGNGYRLPLPLVAARVGDSGRIDVVAGADTAHFISGRDFFLGRAGRAGLRDFSGPAVFIGRPDQSPPARSLTGQVIVTIGSPIPANVLRAWAERGVAGVIVPVTADAPATAEQWVVDAAVEDPVWQPALPIVYAKPALTNALFTGLSPDDPPVRLHHVDADFHFERRTVTSANLYAFVPGTDPVLRDEMVLLTAHYDHLGVGSAVAGDSIYNGFSDNAAGVAMLLEIARALRAGPAPRSVGFLFTSGEERGLLGATYFATYPPIALDRIRAVVNLDGGVPPAPPVRWRVAGDTAALAVRTGAAVVEGRGWIADRTDANANSDHWPFQTRGVPTVFLIPGRDWEGVAPAERDALFERWDRYHQPADEWRDGFPLAGLGRYADLALAITRTLAGGS